MALSGSFGKNVNSRWRLQIDWTATQNITSNTSKVTAKLYWMSTDGYGAVSSSATKTCAIKIDGGSWDSKSASSMASLKANQKKLIHTFTKTVSHDTNGKGSFTLEAYFDAELTLNSYYGRIELDQKSFTLNTIPRKSSLTSSPSWTAGDDRSISISRASTSFTHTIEVFVNNTLIKTIKNVGASTTVNFSVADNVKIFQQFGSASSRTTKIELTTFIDGESIGSDSYTGTCKLPASSTTTRSGDFDIGSSLNGVISSKDSAFTHTIQLIFGGSTFTVASKMTGTNWSYDSSSIASSLYALTPNDNKLSGKLRVFTYYSTEQVGDYVEYSINCNVVDSDPTFLNSQISYSDVNIKTKNITGNPLYIIQNQSDLSVTIGSVATAKNYAKISSYEIKVNGITKTLTDIGSVEMGKVGANNNINMSVKAIDSRGNFTEVTKTVLMIEYKPPSLNPNANRAGSYQNETTFTLNGNVFPLIIGGVDKNSLTPVTGLQYRYKDSKATWANDEVGWINFTWSMSGSKFTATPVVKDLDNTKTFNVEFRVSDKISTFKMSKTVETGQPIFFIDAKKRSISFNDLPKNENEFRVNGRIVFGADQWLSNSGGEGDGAGALFLNNSDITGVNGVFFNDISNNSGEGLLFLKSGRANASTIKDDYDNLYVRDGVMYLNNGSGELAIQNTVNLTGSLVLGTSFVQKDGAMYYNGSNVRIREGGSWGTLATQEQFASGRAVITPAVKDKPTSLTIKFGKTFNTIPTVMVTPNTEVAGSTVTGWAVTAITTTGCTLWATRTNLTDTALYWTAMAI
ncbi:DUF859 family phage minor structural protein [Viridibacillus arvi]|uniref:DUF859 family phage minor structural protein n=1 Tax=Viridibacillus arvi TaxID=263475 RepID=UPI0034CEE3A3